MHLTRFFFNWVASPRSSLSFANLLNGQVRCNSLKDEVSQTAHQSTNSNKLDVHVFLVTASGCQIPPSPSQSSRVGAIGFWGDPWALERPSLER